MDVNNAELMKYKSWAIAQSKLVGRMASAIPAVVPLCKDSLDALNNTLASAQLKSVFDDLDSLKSVAVDTKDLAFIRNAIVDHYVRWAADTVPTFLTTTEIAGALQMANLPTMRLKATRTHDAKYDALTKLAVQFFGNLRALVQAGSIEKHRTDVDTSCWPSSIICRFDRFE